MPKATPGVGDVLALVTALTARVSALETRATSADARLNALSARPDLTSRVSALESQNAGQDTQLATLRTQVEDLMAGGVKGSGGSTTGTGGSGGGGGGGGSTPPPPLTLSTIGTITVVAPAGSTSIPVTIPSPIVTGGTPPYAVGIVPPSGSFFAPGTTPVTITATDSATPPVVTTEATAVVVVIDPSGAGDGSTTAVHSGDDLQAVIDGAVAGDTLVLDAGATFTGNFTLPAVAGSSYITITSSGTLPSATTRILPANVAQLATITNGNTGAVFATDNQAHHWRLLGLNITDSGSGANDLITLGNGGQTSLSDVPHDLILDRCIVTGVLAGGTKRGIALNSKDTTIINCYLSGIRRQGQDSQAIAAWAGPGGYLIENNYCEAASENILLGGADPLIPNLVPTDITIRGNYCYKPRSWQSASGFVVKNLFEAKNCKTVLLENNVFENSWADGQIGYGILFTVRNQDGTASWSTIQDVTVRYNVVKNADGPAVGLLGLDDRPGVVSVQGTNFVLNNLLVLGTSSRGIFSEAGFQPTTVTHCTWGALNNAALGFDGAAMPSGMWIYQNNVSSLGLYGITGSGAQAMGTASLNELAPGSTFDHNVFGGPSIPLPSGNTTLTETQFATALDAMERYLGSAPTTDGLVMGCDVNGLLARIPWLTVPVPDGGTPIALNQHPRLGMTQGDLPTIVTRLATGGEWHSAFQTYVDYVTNTAQWDSTSTSSQELALWAAAAGFLYQVRASGDPAGITFNGKTRAAMGAKGVDWLTRAMVNYPANDERNRPLFFAYDWLHDLIPPTTRSSIIGTWKTGVMSAAAVINAEAAYPAYTGFNWFDSQYAGYYGDWILAGLAAKGDGIEEAWLQTGIDRHAWAYRGTRGIVTMETTRNGTDGGFMQMLAYGIGFVMGRVSPVELAYRSAFAISAATFYDSSTAGWLRSFVPYVARGVLPFGKANGSAPDGHEWLISREPTAARFQLTYGSYAFWWIGLARTAFPGLDDTVSRLAVWLANHRTLEPSQPESWTFSRFLAPNQTEGSPTTLSIPTDQHYQAGKWQCRTGWASQSDAQISIYAFQFGRSPAGSFTVDYHGPAIPLGSGANHDWDSTNYGGFHSTMGFPEQGRSTLETGRADFDDYGYPRTYDVDADAQALAVGSTAEHVPPAGTIFRAPTTDGIGYLSLDLSRAYNGTAVLDGRGNAPKVGSYTRRFLYVPPATPGTDPLRLFVFDSATVLSHAAAFEKRQTFVMPVEPTSDGTPHANDPVRNGSGARKTRYTGASVVSWGLTGSGEMSGAANTTFLTPLTPSCDLVKVGYRFVDGNGNPRLEDAYGRTGQTGSDGEWSNIQVYDAYIGWWRVELIPTVTQLTDHFCTAIEVAPTSGASRSTTEAVQGTNFVGGRIGDAIGVHRTTTGTSGTFVLPSSGTYLVAVAGLTASTSRTIAQGGNISSVTAVVGGGSSPFTTTAQGTLALTIVVTSSGTGAANTVTVS